MKTKNTVKPNLEQLDDRIVPATIKGGTSSGLTWVYNDVSNKINITGTGGNDSITLWSFGSTLGIIDGNGAPTYFFNTNVPLSSSLKIQVNGGGGNDYINNALPFWTYDKATLSGGSGNDLVKAGGGHDTLYGDDGDDCLVGAIGSFGYPATMIGGTGSDVFITQASIFGGRDSVADFDADDDVQYDTSGATSLSMSSGDFNGHDPIVWLNGNVVWQA